MTGFIGFMRRVDALIPLISKLCIFISSVAIFVLLVIFGWLVFGRYVLNVTPTWVEQMALLLVVYITFLGAAAGVHEEFHLGVSFIREAMPDAIRKPLRIVVDLLMAGFGAVMFYACVQLVQFGWSTNLAMLHIPEGVRTLAAAICGFLICLFATSKAISRIYQDYFADPSASKPDVS